MFRGFEVSVYALAKTKFRSMIMIICSANKPEPLGFSDCCLSVESGPSSVHGRQCCKYFSSRELTVPGRYFLKKYDMV
jgi:hypothetical protein